MSTLEAGAAAVDITPTESITLAGWGNRDHPSEGVSHALFAKALAVRDAGGHQGLWITADILGYSRTMADSLEHRIAQQYGLEPSQVILGSSHNHSGPYTPDLLHLYFDISQSEQEVADRYTAGLLDKIVALAGLALADLAPARFSFGLGLAGFGVNRRRARGKPTTARPLPQVVDHDVPVLAVHSTTGELRAVVFGYACHTTAIYGYTLNADYAGYAQTYVQESNPGAVAMFAAGCGGDINPYPRWQPGLGEAYGRILGGAVQDVLESGYGEMQPLSGPLRTGAGEPQLDIVDQPTRSQLQAVLAGRTATRKREIAHQLAILDGGQPLQTGCGFPVRVWRFGSGQTIIALAGEPVVDYSLRFRAAYGWTSTWVAGYSHVLLAYIPSRRVLLEGGYEGHTGMLEYGLPGPFAETVEETIAAAVQELVISLGNERPPFPRPSPIA